MDYLISLFVIGGIVYLLVRSVCPKAPATTRTATARAQRQSAARNTPTPAAPTGPITTERAACDLLHVLLASRSAYLRNGAASDMREEMREHAQELRESIDHLQEEIAKQREYREGIAEDLADQSDEPGTPVNDEVTARMRRHLGHLDREMAEMLAKLAADKQALHDFRADRTAWVHAYARHVLHDEPTPNLGHTRHIL
jgi:hypothetical protein